jgi:hypothetical protein
MPKLYIYTVYDRLFGDLLAKNVLYGSGQPYLCLMKCLQKIPYHTTEAVYNYIYGSGHPCIHCIVVYVLCLCIVRVYVCPCVFQCVYVRVCVCVCVCVCVYSCCLRTESALYICKLCRSALIQDGATSFTAGTCAHPESV